MEQSSVLPQEDLFEQLMHHSPHIRVTVPPTYLHTRSLRMSHFEYARPSDKTIHPSEVESSDSGLLNSTESSS
jgi:hypothetical protein